MSCSSDEKEKTVWEEMTHFSFRARLAWCGAKVSHARHEKENKYCIAVP